MTDELIALIVRETGWPLEYIRNQPLTYLMALAEEFQYVRAVESYERAYNAALIVCVLASSRTRHYKPADIVGEPPKRRDMTKRKDVLSKQPATYPVTLLDGKDYNLPALNLNLMADLEEEFDLGLEEISNLLQTRQASALRRTLYTMVHPGYPDITKQDIGKLVDLSNLEDIAKAVAKALSGE